MSRRDALFGAVGLIAGVVLALLAVLLWKKDVQFQAEVGIDDLLAALVALGIALGIGYLLQERNHSLQSKSELQRAERERLIALTEEVVEQAGEVRTFEVRLSRGEVKHETALAELRRFSNTLTSLEKRLARYEVLDSLGTRFTATKAAFSDYRILIGESTHIPNPPTPAERDQKFNALADELDALIRDLSRIEWPDLESSS